jgi:hypothetical protein
MGKHTPTPPPAPDPTVVANAQSSANIATAQAQQKMNMINSYGPYGNVSYSADPNAPGGYSQTTTLSPEEQAIYQGQTHATTGALGLANDQIGRIGTALGTPLSTEGLPALSGSVDLSGLHPGQGVNSSFDGGPALQYGFDKGPALRFGFNPGQTVQGHVGGDLDAARYQNMNAVYGQAASRLDPQWDMRQHQLENKLANQGLGVNDTAYQNASGQFGRDRNDAYNQAIFSSVGAGETAANDMFQRQLGQGQFANQAAAQMYGQNMGQAQFNNQAAGQQYGQNLGEAQFYNQTAGQQFGQDMSRAQFGNTAQAQAYGQQLQAAQMAQANAQFGNQTRNQGLQERAYLQNQPIDQFSALMSGAQVQTPQGVQYTPSQVGQTDVLGAYALNQQAQQAAYQAQMQNRSSNMSGLFQLGAAALMAPMTGGASLGAGMGAIVSDARAKTDIRRVGTLDNGAGIYTFRYRSGGPPQIGVMAQELAQVRPDLVHDLGGVLAVEYGGL